ncbi:MAG: hypothetical protein H6585_08045 [Flavobacteriales bacterium]|nr:hypothetical protein [Flavobacteriales bacterium]MCB9448279.1 hypothetical protein [Flavobacteriales bacterium]
MQSSNAKRNRLSRFSTAISAVLYGILALEFYNRNHIPMAALMAFAAMCNVVVMRIQVNLPLLSGIISNTMNSLAAAGMAYHLYQEGGRYPLWIAITLAYLTATVVFVRKKNKAVS